MAIKKSRKKTKKKTVNFDGVEGRILLPEGDYGAHVSMGELKESDAGNDYISWTFTIEDDDKKFNNQRAFYNTSLLPQALWNLRNLLESLGVEIPEDDVEIDELIEEAKDCQIILTIEHETYDGKKRAKVSDFMPFEDAEVEDDNETEEVEEEEEDEAEEVVEDDDDEAVTFSVEEVNEMDTDELKQVNKDLELGVNIKKIKTAKKLVAAIIDALEKKGLLAE